MGRRETKRGGESTVVCEGGGRGEGREERRGGKVSRE